MISFKQFISEDTVTHGYTTKRHADGYDWEVHKWEYGKEKKTVKSGTEQSREIAVQKAKDHHKKLEQEKKKKLKESSLYEGGNGPNRSFAQAMARKTTTEEEKSFRHEKDAHEHAEKLRNDHPEHTVKVTKFTMGSKKKPITMHMVRRYSK